jgi:hypothetical protein
MKYNITFKGGKEVATEMTKDEFESLYKRIRNGDLKMIKIDDNLYNVYEISSITKSNEPEIIAKEFRLPEETPRTEEQKELEAIDKVKYMNKIYQELKKKGIIK